MTLAEIIARMNQIDAEVRSCTEAAQIEALTAELQELQEKRAQLEAAAARHEEARGIQAGTVDTVTVATGATVVEERHYDASSPEYRTAFLKNIAVDRDGKHFLGEMTKEERAAFTFTTANTGNVVPTTMLNKIVDRVKADAPMIEDAVATMIEGVFSYPVRTAIAQGDAAVVAQDAANADEQDTFVLATLTGVDIKKHAILSRRMQFQSVDAFEDWLVADISKRIAVAEEAVARARLDGSAPATGESANANVKINSSTNVLTSQAYSDAVIRNIMSLIDENGEVVIYANASTIWNGLAGIVDADNQKIMIPNGMVDPVVQGRIYGATVKKDSNLANNVAYFGVKGALKINRFGPMEVFPTREAKTANMIYTGVETFDAGLENDKAFVKVTFTT
ncbi:MAG: phage major capsid protein [Eubacterium sp.]|nr:phage major capsid protein [Eubacterium sp.]